MTHGPISTLKTSSCAQIYGDLAHKLGCKKSPALPSATSSAVLRSRSLTDIILSQFDADAAAQTRPTKYSQLKKGRTNERTNSDRRSKGTVVNPSSKVQRGKAEKEVRSDRHCVHHRCAGRRGGAAGSRELLGAGEERRGEKDKHIAFPSFLPSLLLVGLTCTHPSSSGET